MRVIVEDKKVPPDKIATKHHAKLTAPEGILIRKSTIPGAGLGTFTTKFIPDGVTFGPYGGEVTWDRGDTPIGDRAYLYAWEIENANGTAHYVNAVNPANSNWLRYVNCARIEEEQNMKAYQERSQIYYETIKAIYPGEELLVYYGDAYAKTLGFKIEQREPPEKSLISFDNVYEVSVETGDQSDAGTNATVYVTAEGEHDMVSYALRDEDGKQFERGETDTFEVTIFKNVGGLRRIRVGHDNTGADGGWFLVKLTMTGSITGREFIFNCNCWLDPSNGTAWYQYIDAEEMS
ncbi:lipoxygenase homology domain-containing protein 1-like [Lineus longissimus]|uniref:lipoxygenase homology domain-containing protein 1-like n=1 Tax=Lineus longissimus TaxID=88925 RepID=UPI00315D4195